MELNHLKYFYEVARAGSFSQAARELNVAQPSLSKTVSLLEDRENVVLLERSKKGVSLTPMGREVYNLCEQMFQLHKEIVSKVQNRETSLSGPVRFGVSDHVAKYFMTKSLEALMTEHPNIIPHLSVSSPLSICNNILNDSLEFGLIFSKMNLPYIEQVELFKAKMVFVCTKGYLKKIKTKKLSEVSIIASNQKSFKKSKLKKKTDLSFKVNIETNNQELQKEFCLNSLGAVILPEFMLKNELLSGKLVELGELKENSLPLLLTYRSGHAFSNASKAIFEISKSIHAELFE